jgi:hypothetical protein
MMTVICEEVNNTIKQPNQKEEEETPPPAPFGPTLF